MKPNPTSFFCILLLISGVGNLTAQNTDTVRAGRYDNGKMWTFENPPVEYLNETYGFAPDSDWFNRARLSTLRIPGCSASFVTPNGLIATNHHCGRGSVIKVTREGENLLDEGFYAPSLADERRVPGYYADQLVRLEDVTDRVYAQLNAITDPAERARQRTDVVDALEAELQSAYAGSPDSMVVQIVSLYHGGRYSAYHFRRYTDLRLVMAPEVQLGYFGGDWDNFTYPRYDLDFSLFRAYDASGKPLQTSDYFKWSTEGVHENDLVFVVGNPGSTRRLETMAQLEYRRDVEGKVTLDVFSSRIKILQALNAVEPSSGVRNMIFSLSNTQKALAGRQDALNDPMIMARRADNERRFLEAIAANTELKATYGDAVQQMAELQRQKAELGGQTLAFARIGDPSMASPVLVRGIYAWLMNNNPAQAERYRESLHEVADVHASTTEPILAAKIDELVRGLGSDAAVSAFVAGLEPAAVAREILSNSVLRDTASTANAIAAGPIPANDPALRLAGTFMPAYMDYNQRMQAILLQEQEVASSLGRARYEIHGTSVPPDATFSLRIADGVVKPYAYNGTLAPWHTTFYGMYDRYHSFGPGTDWDLPGRWLNPPTSFDRSTPMNFITTSDTIGGNSGSPIVNRDLEIVGLNFDRNVEGLSRDFIYLPERGRNMGVDVRAVLESLDDIYDADRLVVELTSGKVTTEAEAAD